MLDTGIFDVIIVTSTVKTSYLIKSGGGNGPVKPGNLRKQGAKSGGVTKDEAFQKQMFNAPSEDGALIFCL